MPGKTNKTKLLTNKGISIKQTWKFERTLTKIALKKPGVLEANTYNTTDFKLSKLKQIIQHANSKGVYGREKVLHKPDFCNKTLNSKLMETIQRANSRKPM